MNRHTEEQTEFINIFDLTNYNFAKTEIVLGQYNALMSCLPIAM